MIDPGRTGDKQVPQVTFALFTYNQANYVREAVVSALSQDCGALEIILSDDCSTDGTFEIMCETVAGYSGPHRVVLRRERVNLGLIGHINAVLALSCGEYIVLAAGDDISTPDRVSQLSRKMMARPLLIHSGFEMMDETGKPVTMKRPHEALLSGDLAAITGARELYVGATGCWHRALFDKYGPISFSEAYEDLVMGYRAALERSVAYIDRPLVRYRVGTGITTKHGQIRSKLLRASRAMSASFDQRLLDTQRHHPQRRDLISILERERKCEQAVTAFLSDPATFFFRYSWRPSVQLHFLQAMLTKFRNRFAK